MRRTIVALIILAGAVAVLGGCSGAGAPAADVRGASVQTLAADNLSALALFSEWTKALYPKSGTPTVNGPEPQPDGSLRFWGANSDGSTFEWFMLPDGSSTGTIVWPSGLRFTQVGDVTVYSPDGLHATEHFVNTYPDGGRLECSVVTDFSVPTVTTSVWTGTATLKDGRATRFVLQRALPGQDELTVDLDDGTQLHYVLPLENAADGFPPAYTLGAKGSLKSPGGKSLGFTASGQDDWAKWSIQAAGGFTGEFALREDGRGDGQLREGEALAGALRWTDGLVGTLDLLGAAHEQVTPSAAARDGGLTRWCQNANALHPMPMY